MKKNLPNLDPYKKAGVDIDAGNNLVEAIKPLAAKTRKPEVISGIGGFGALYELPTNFKNPILVSGSDGVGTKLKLACAMNQHRSIGIDLVAMSVNDILTQGAKPLFFHDYLSCGKLNVNTATDVVAGIAKGCLLADCSLIGGETAEMPGMYNDAEYDLAGFAVGVVEKNDMITGKNISSGDQLIGINSSGVHSNGYSMINHILEKTDMNLSSKFGDSTLGHILLTPTRIYVEALKNLKQKMRVKGIAHITGGGLIENLPRIIPPHLSAKINISSWEMPEIFRWISEEGNIEESSMMRIFNCGVGMVVVVSKKNACDAVQALKISGDNAFLLGEVVAKSSEENLILTR